MFNNKINFDLFKNVEYCKLTVQQFTTYWQELLNIDIENDSKEIMYSGFTYCSIMYANSDDAFKENYPTFDNDMYILIYKLIQRKGAIHFKNWQLIIEKILQECPQYPELVGINWVHRHHPQWHELREIGLNRIIDQVLRNLRH